MYIMNYKIIDNLKNRTIRISLIDVLIFVYLTLSIIFFFLFAKPDINNSTEIAGYSASLGMYADHPTYVNFFNALDKDAWIYLLIKPNYAGPFIILFLFGDNLNTIFLFNIICLVASLKLISSYLYVNNTLYTILLLINPITFISLFSVNKEIITLISVNLFIIYLANKRIWFLISAILIGFLARKELSLLYIAFYLITLIVKNWHKHILYLSVLLLILFTVSGFFIDRIFNSIEGYSTEVETAVTNSGTKGTILILNKIQKDYGYIFAFIPKLFLNLFGSVLSRTYNLFFFEHVYNDIVVWGQSFLFIIIVPKSLTIYKKSNHLFTKEMFFIFILLCIFFSYIPVVQNRYFYSGYLILIVLISNIVRSEKISAVRF